MRVVQTLRFQTQLSLLTAQFPQSALFVQAEIDHAGDNPDLVSSLPVDQADFREVVVDLPGVPSITLLVILRGGDITFFDIRW